MEKTFGTNGFGILSLLIFKVKEGGGLMTIGGQKKGMRKMKRSHYFDDAYLDTGLSKGEAERRAWKALSELAVGERFANRGKF